MYNVTSSKSFLWFYYTIYEHWQTFPYYPSFRLSEVCPIDRNSTVSQDVLNQQFFSEYTTVMFEKYFVMTKSYT